MTDLRQAAQAALEALDCVDLISLVPDYGSGHYSVPRLDGKSVGEAREALRAALAAEPVPPVAFADKIAFEGAMRAGKGCDVWPTAGDYTQRTGRKLVALYTRPPAAEPAQPLPARNPALVQCGDDFWADCEQFPRADWVYQVQNGDTVAGYWDWVVGEAELHEIPIESLVAAK